MDRIKLKISSKDWIYIVIIGAFFGFLLSLFFYFLNIEFKNFSTIIFTVFCSILISLFAFVLITLSNDYILPKIEERFWYFISFIFSFLSGFLGFSFSYFIFLNSGFNIIEYISSFWITISIIVGFLTFLIGLILHQFIFMKHKNEVIKSETLESKIKALENELNPHFLFNALNSISELIYIDKQKAEKATLDLSQFLRNAINKESLVSIKTELEMVKTYLEIENIRFDNNIILSIESEQNTQERLIPKFSIQLLVENAIKHGYVADKLYIYIKIFEEKIIVSNSGKVTKNISFGTGLNNLKKRLVLLKIGELDYKVEKDMMNFIIVLKGSR
ncbi:sensor histidine kinase [Halarcobacter ebronensis]|uniref:Histidine kinase n=1 Tax=Halarcobacter ebronensis TaxID=1462615 RepID=A0A4Q1AYE4_9BACT|nr:histidine kinase [Halarcobacter ebronensis]QKF82695.1 two-component system sensor histidine kinase, LytS/YehU family [Halarcobacter ebronensis]RXK06721.1 histidine kinase [Halarcobacter ebronensis]